MPMNIHLIGIWVAILMIGRREGSMMVVGYGE